MRALQTAATGMAAQELNVQVIANNIANMNTTGFKRQRAEFEDLLYEQQRRVGTQTSDQGTILPAGIELGAGVKTVGTPRIMAQGSLTQTSSDFDLAIQGEGFFRIQLPDGTLAYTRDGSFQLNAQGQLVTSDGNLVQPTITVAQNTTQVTINSQGQVSATLPGNSTPSVIGQIELTRFVNKAGLQGIGNNLFVQTPASGAPQDGLPQTDGRGSLQQDYLEQSNVDPVTEISNLIAAQRAYEMNTKIITAADQMMQTLTTMNF